MLGVVCSLARRTPCCEQVLHADNADIPSTEFTAWFSSWLFGVLNHLKQIFHKHFPFCSSRSCLLSMPERGCHLQEMRLPAASSSLQSIEWCCNSGVNKQKTLDEWKGLGWALLVLVSLEEHGGFLVGNESGRGNYGYKLWTQCGWALSSAENCLCE